VKITPKFLGERKKKSIGKAKKKRCLNIERNPKHLEMMMMVINISNNRGNKNHLKIIQKILEQQTRKARHQGTT
jgi:hypothetical protein